MTDYELDRLLAFLPCYRGKAPLVYFAPWGTLIIKHGNLDTTNTYL